MTKYYHNENPQVELWMDQARRNQKLFFDYKNKCDFQKEVIKNLVSELSKLKLEARDFNSLPWWRKMFYKFKV
jgi:hypothetical protein